MLPKHSSCGTSALGRITRGSHIAYYSLMFFIAYTFKGEVHVFARQVKIVSHSSCRTSAILKYFCPLSSVLSIYIVTTFCLYSITIGLIFNSCIVADLHLSKQYHSWERSRIARTSAASCFSVSIRPRAALHFRKNTAIASGSLWVWYHKQYHPE